ncbi:MAG TPA: hypothetical protein VF533_05505 [Solirubrobacteraceae bacterium]
MKVNELLRAALALLDEPVGDAAGSWPHGVAVLTRQAIESTMTHWWQRVVPEMEDANWTEKWLALPSYLGRAPVIGDAHYAWTVLSEACHHRAYEIGLTEPELRTLLRTANEFAKLVGARLAERAAKEPGAATA